MFCPDTVVCPPLSNGSNVPAGCTCDDGHSGTGEKSLVLKTFSPRLGRALIAGALPWLCSERDPLEPVVLRSRLRTSGVPTELDRDRCADWLHVRCRCAKSALSAVTPVSHNPIYSVCPSCSQQATLETSPLHELPTTSTTATAGRTASRGRLNTRIPQRLPLR